MNLLLRWDRSCLVIAIAVCAVHLALVVYMAFQPVTQSTRLPRKPLIVQSIQLQPAQPKPSTPQVAKPVPEVTPTVLAEVKEAAVTETPRPKKEKKIESTPVKKEPMAKPTVKKEKSVTLPVAKEEGIKKPKISADKIAQVKASLLKIERGQIAMAPIPATGQANDLPVTDVAGPTYEETLADRLRLLLTLPDYGDVKISLTLDRRGKVMSLKILQSDSGENRQYVESKLPNLSLPAFGSFFSSEDSHTFTLVLSN